MKQWAKFFLFVAGNIAIVGAQCPSEFACPKYAPWCYLIYPTSNDGWKYKDHHGVTYNASYDVYESPNCYEFIAIDDKEGPRSCIDAQQECEKLGGNITVINSIDECEQLTNNVLHILSIREDNTTGVDVQNLTMKDISMGCATIMTEDGYTINAINIINSDNTTTSTIVCESNDLNTRIFPEPTTIGFTHTLKNKPEMKVGPQLWIIAVIPSSVVVTIATILLLMRRRQRNTKSGHDKRVDKVEYKDYVAEDVHEYATHNAVVQYQKTTPDEAVYQDIKDTIEYLYHDTASVEVVYDDTAAVEVDTAVKVVYQNSDVDRSKQDEKRVGGQASVPCSSQALNHKDSGCHKEVTSSPDRVDILYESSIDALGRREFQLNDDYSEIDACMPNENKRMEPYNYLEIIG